MNQDDLFSGPTFPLQSPPQEQNRLCTSDSQSSFTNECEHVFVTLIRATNVACGLRRVPAGFHVIVDVDGRITQTSNKSVSTEKDVVEWDEIIPLPSDESSFISFSVYASFELGPRLGNGELLGQIKVSVEEVSHRNWDGLLQLIDFTAEKDDTLSPCSMSLHIITGRRVCNTNESCPKLDLPGLREVNALEQLTDEGHRALQRYCQLENQMDLDAAIKAFERVQEICPIDHPNRSAVLLNLAHAKFVDRQARHPYLDLDAPIALYQGALRLRSKNHPDRSATALELGLALLVRFRKRGFEFDRVEAMVLLAGVVEVSGTESYAYRAGLFGLQIAEASVYVEAGDAESLPPEQANGDSAIREARDMLRNLSYWHPRRPALLVDLALLLSNRFLRKGIPADIHEAISMFEYTMDLTQHCQADTASLLGNLGRALLCRFKHLGDLADINRSISTLEQAVCLTPDDHPDKPGRLNNLGNSLCRRFDHLGDLADLNKAISILQEAVRLTADGHPEKAGCMSNLGNSVLNRYERFGNLVDLNQSIAMFEEVVRLTSHCHPEKPALLDNLGDSLFRRFERLGDLMDLNRSISMFDGAVCLTIDSHPDKPGRLNNLGNSLLDRFERLGDVVDLNRSISIIEEAVCLTPDGHPRKAVLLGSLGNSLLRRFHRLGELADLEKSILMLEQAVCLTSNSHPDRPAWLCNLGKSLLSHFERLGDLADLNKSISRSEEAVCLTPDSHPEKTTRLSNLGSSLLSRFNHLGDLADLNRSISMRQEVVSLTPDGHPNKPRYLNNLGIALSRLFEQLGNLADLNRSILMFEEAVCLTPDDHPTKPDWLNHLGTSLCSRFIHLGDLVDLNRSISVQEEAVCLTPDGHPAKLFQWNNLANSLSCRFNRLGDLADLNRSISMQDEVVRLIPDGHLNKPAQLSNLGTLLSRRFRHLGNIVDLDKSILVEEQAIYLTSDGHPDRSTRLSNLGSSLLSRFERVEDPADLNKTISMIEEAISLAPDGHPDKPVFLTNLGDAYRVRFKHFHDSSDLSAASLKFSAACHASTGRTSSRFRATRGWISCAQLQGNTTALLDACSSALDLLPQLAWLGVPVTERHRLLIEAAHVTRDSVAAALQAGNPQLAVEWLEQGRSIVWTQFLQLRTPADDLAREYPALAHQFREISQELERVSTRDNPTFIQPDNISVADTRLLENDIQKHHDLALRRENLLRQIRSLPGFDRFLLSKTIKQLAALAISGPVVYFTASKERCDALIVMAESESVIHVPLAKIRYVHIEGMRKVLRSMLERDCLVVSRDVLYGSAPAEDIDLSKEFVNLLLNGDLSDGSDRAEKLTKPERLGGPAKMRSNEYTSNELYEMILKLLWNDVVNPVLQALGLSSPPSSTDKMTRIFWCPTGPFSFVPIHAAGLYNTTESGTKLSDFAISSYLPTLASLASSPQNNLDHLSSNLRLLAIPQPPTDGFPKLFAVKHEISSIKELSDKSPFVTLQNSDATVEDVMEKLKNNDWVHFACHGIQDPKTPLDSGLCLANNRRLKLSDIMQLSRPKGGLAFLSACQTAQGDETLSEESVHLVAGMLLAGYGSVIGTMWSIMDKDAPKVAKNVYEYLFRDAGRVPDSTEAAVALHYAIQKLRGSGAPFSSWVPFIHFGR